MAIFYRKLRVPIGLGLNTKVDEKSLPPVELLELENGVFGKEITIAKRFGYDRLPTNVVGSGTFYPTVVTTGSALATVNDELVLFDRRNAYGRNETTDEWVLRGAVQSVVIDHPHGARITTEQLNPDCAEADGVVGYCWEDSRGGVRYSVLDASTGAALVNDRLLQGAPARSPKVRALNNKLVFVWHLPVAASSGKIRAQAVNPRDVFGSIANASNDIVTDVHQHQRVFDLDVVGNNGVLAYFDSNGNPKVGYVTPQAGVGSSGSSHSVPRVINTDYGKNSISICNSDTLQQLCLSYVSGTVSAGVDDTTVRWQLLNYNLTTASIVQDVASSTAEGIRNVASDFRDEPTVGSDGYDVVWFWEVTGSSAQNHLVKYRSKNLSTSAPSAQATGTLGTVRHSGLASRAWAVGRDVYATLSHDTTLQSMYFGLRDDGLFVTRVFPGNGGGLQQSGTLGNVQNTTASVYLWAGTFKERLDARDHTGSVAFFSDRGARGVRMDFASPRSHRTAEVDRTLFLGGGYLAEYDGNRFVENGFHVFPENVTLTSAATSDGALTNSSVLGYLFFWEHYNLQGTRTQSSTAEVKRITLGASDNCVTASVPSLAHTMRSGSDVARARLAVYRSTHNGSVYFRADDPADPVFNDTNADTVTFVDILSDDDLKIREPAYLSAGEVENVPPPSCHLVAQGKERLFVAGLEDPNEVRYSKPRRFDRSYSFNDENQVLVDPDGGPITALAVMDDKVVVFKRTRIYVFTGDGRDATGVGSFTEPQLVTSDVGCKDPRSLALTPKGLMFQSTKGIWLLDRGLGTTYIGAKVEEHNGITITSTDVIEDTNQVVFLSDGPTTLMYDYHYGQWSVWTRHGGGDSAVSDGTYHYVRTNGEVMRQATGNFRDDGVRYGQRIRIGWVKPGETLQDFGSFRGVHIIGKYKGPHRLRVRTYYNYREQWQQERYFNTSASLSTGSYGDLGYGSGSYGGGEPVYQFYMPFNRQRAQAVSLEFEDLPIDDDYGDSFELSELVFEVGVHRGPYRLSTKRTN